MSRDPFPSSPLPESSRIITGLRSHPLLRSVAYAVSINVIGLAATYVVNPDRSREWSMTRDLAIHTLACPFMVGLTYAFVTLRKEDLGWWNQALLKHPLRQVGLGIMLGSAVYVTMTGVACILGWVHFPVRGWQASSNIAVMRTLLSHLANLFLAWNEEILYRGYGLRSLSQAVGMPAAAIILVPVFAWGHGSGWQVFIGQSALGLALTALRLVNSSLWLPIGYHAAWNYVQTAIFGPPEASPSLRPMQVDGPHLWVGQPGYPVPGLLSTLANLLVAASAAVIWWRWRRQPPARPF